MTPARKTSYLVFGALIVAVVLLHLGPVLLAGLFSFMILDLTYRRLAPRMPDLPARWLALIIFLVTAVCLSWMFGFFLKLALARTPLILASLIPKIDGLASRYGIDLPFENLHEFRVVTIEALKENARSVTRASGLLTKGFFQIVVGIFIAILCFFSEHPRNFKPTLFDEVRKEFNARVSVFMLGFEKILGAQVFISLINTAVTAVFLLAVGMPYLLFLTLATFIFGIIPILGNIATNTIIVCTALTISPRLAVFALLFLVLSHKAQYILSGKIMGAYIDSPVWVILLGLLIGEAVIGLPGMLLAPAIIHYLREEMQAIPASD